MYICYLNIPSCFEHYYVGMRFLYVASKHMNIEK